MSAPPTSTTSPSPPPSSSIQTLSTPLLLRSGLRLPTRLVKCPMQETLAQAPLFDPPHTFQALYKRWAHSGYGLIITGQVQVDPRFLSVPGDVCVHARSEQEPHISLWREWARVAKSGDTPCVVQLAHPGRMSPAGAGNRPGDMRAWCPSEVPVDPLGTSWVDTWMRDRMLGCPKAMSLAEVDEVVGLFVRGARVAVSAGFDGVQIHGAHGFLVSQFLSPHTNRREDAYGGDPERRMALLRRLVREIREVVPKPLCLGVKLNSADYMADGKGLQVEEGLQQIKWLVECGMVDFVEISGGNAENKTSGLQQSFLKRSLDKAPARKESTRVREAFFTEFREKVQELGSDVPYS